MYKFEKIEKGKRGRKSGMNLFVSENANPKAGKRITIWNDYRKLHPTESYAYVFYDKETSALGFKFSLQKDDTAFFIYGPATLSSTSFDFPNGLYQFKETTVEGIDVFILKTNETH